MNVSYYDTCYYFKSCITDKESPSSLDSRCKSLQSHVPLVQNSTVHLFNPNKVYLTTCYPAFDGLNENPKGTLLFVF